MKIIFKGETKRVPVFNDFLALAEYCQQIFQLKQSLTLQHDLCLKLFYVDEDGDVISVTCQSDLDEINQLYQSNARLAIAASNEDAREALLSGRPSTQMELEQTTVS